MISFTGFGNTTTDLSKNSNVVTQNDYQMTKVVVIGFSGVGLTAATLAELNESVSIVEIESIEETKVYDYKIDDLDVLADYNEAPEPPAENHPRQLHNFNKNLNTQFHPYPTYRKARDGLRYSF